MTTLNISSIVSKLFRYSTSSDYILVMNILLENDLFKWYVQETMRDSWLWEQIGGYWMGGAWGRG